MNAVPKQPAPRSVADLSADIAALEKTLMEIRRDECAARTKLPRFIEEGDTIRSTDARRSIELAPARIASLSAELEQTREALKLAKGRVQGTAHARTYKEIKACAEAAHQELLEWADAVDVVCQRFNAASAKLQTLAEQTTRAGVSPESYAHPHLMFRRQVELFERGLCLGTKGAIGKVRTLNDQEQLAKGVTGSSVIRHAAAEFLELTLRRVQAALESE
jgi:hypothetical protein